MALNAVNITGNLTSDPEVKYTQGGTAVCNVTVAVNERVKVGEEWTDKTLFIDVVLWKRNAENAGQYLSKGSKVLIGGRLAQDEWQDKQTQQKRTKIKIVAHYLEFIGGKQDQASTPQQETTSLPSGGFGDDDDIPFN